MTDTRGERFLSLAFPAQIVAGAKVVPPLWARPFMNSDKAREGLPTFPGLSVSASMTIATVPDDLPVILFPSAAALEAWLEREHPRSAGIWLKIAKKGSGVESVTYAEAVELGLCFGWIDGQGRRFDDRHYLQRFTPRRPRSKWSRLNCERVEALSAAGRMRPSGLAAVEAAKADGRWDAAYEPASTAAVPPDLERELKRDRAARESFEALDGANRYAIIYRLNDAKRPQTRERRLRKFVEMLRRGERIHP
jgi:uncharacterized protein YdeI (YjbR/CyaY-like superfamily)